MYAICVDSAHRYPQLMLHFYFIHQKATAALRANTSSNSTRWLKDILLRAPWAGMNIGKEWNSENWSSIKCAIAADTWISIWQVQMTEVDCLSARERNSFDVTGGDIPLSSLGINRCPWAVSDHVVWCDRLLPHSCLQYTQMIPQSLVAFCIKQTGRIAAQIIKKINKERPAGNNKKERKRVRSEIQRQKNKLHLRRKKGHVMRADNETDRRWVYQRMTERERARENGHSGRGREELLKQRNMVWEYHNVAQEEDFTPATRTVAIRKASFTYSWSSYTTERCTRRAIWKKWQMVATPTLLEEILAE